jgi:hypothetical protein
MKLAKNLPKLILLILTILSFSKALDEEALIKEMETFNSWVE